MRSLLPLFLATSLSASQQTPSGQTPTQAPVVGIGDARVDGRRIHPGSITRKLTLIGMGPPREAGTVTQTIELSALDGHAAMLSVQAFAGGTVDSSFFDPRTLRPLRQRSHNPARVMSLDFDSAHVTGQYAAFGKPHVPIDQRLPMATFDSNVADLVIAALPLARGFTARIPVYMYESGGLVWYGVRVTGTDSLAGGAGAKTAVWTVEMQSPQRKVRYWIGKANRQVLKSEYELGAGQLLNIEVQ